MKRFFTGFLLACTLAALFSCEKTELETIDDNQAPPDRTVETVTLENYVTRAYILALGREPDSAELSQQVNALKAANADSASRRALVDAIFSDPDYLPRLYDQNRIDLLNNVDTAEYTNWINIFRLLLQDSAYQFQWPVLEYELDRMTALRDAFSQFIAGAIDIRELHRRMCNNYLYDQINMGSANFVISTFQHFIDRNPTTAEQQSGVSMVDGNNAVLFLQAGASKNDYLTIVTSARNYYEAQVVLLYRKYLQRDPGTVEMSAGTDRFLSTGDYTAVQRDLLSTDEFIGIE
jgi:hypothetical protein